MGIMSLYTAFAMPSACLAHDTMFTYYMVRMITFYLILWSMGKSCNCWIITSVPCTKKKLSVWFSFKWRSLSLQKVTYGAWKHHVKLQVIVQHRWKQTSFLCLDYKMISMNKYNWRKTFICSTSGLVNWRGSWKRGITVYTHVYTGHTCLKCLYGMTSSLVGWLWLLHLITLHI